MFLVSGVFLFAIQTTELLVNASDQTVVAQDSITEDQPWDPVIARGMLLVMTGCRISIMTTWDWMLGVQARSVTIKEEGTISDIKACSFLANGGINVKQNCIYH